VKEIMLARQPVLDSKQETYAYELLYRGNFPDIGDDAMTATVLSNMLNRVGIDSVANGLPVFVNISKKFLLGEFPKILPPDRTILEIKEDVPGDADVIASMQYWKSKGFKLALDNFSGMESKHSTLLPYADIVKVDVLAYQDKLEELMNQLRNYPIQLVAEKVESLDQYELCKKVGFHYFQGYFFCKPSIIRDQQSLNTNKTQLLQLLSHILTAASPMELEYEIAHDMALSYKLLRYINSASVGLRKQVNSIGHALTLMGLDKLRVWVSMLLVSSLSKGKPDALLLLSFCRGRFLEQLAANHNDASQSNDYFILGMFSLLDALLDQDVTHVVKSMTLPELVRDGLLNHSSDPAIKLNLIRAMEKGDWAQLDSLLDSVELNDKKITSIYTEAVQWAEEKITLLNTMS